MRQGEETGEEGSERWSEGAGQRQRRRKDKEFGYIWSWMETRVFDHFLGSCCSDKTVSPSPPGSRNTSVSCPEFTCMDGSCVPFNMVSLRQFSIDSKANAMYLILFNFIYLIFMSV